jgi:hypothetical protein
MEYLSLVSSLSKQDLVDLAKQMKICCSGNKTEICDRVIGIVAKFEKIGGQQGGKKMNIVKNQRYLTN